MTPNQLNASQPASSIAQLGRGARGSSVSRSTTASVAALPPAIAVSTTPPDSSAASDAASASRETTACGQSRRCRVRRIAAGVATISANANDTPSRRMSKDEPNPSGPSVSSSEERMGAQTATTAATAPQPPTAAATRPRSKPAKPQAAMTAAAARGTATGATTTTDGTRLVLRFQSLQRLADALRAVFELGHDLGRRLLPELLVGQLRLGLLEIRLEALALLVATRIALPGRKGDPPRRCGKRRALGLRGIDELDAREGGDEARDAPVDRAVEVQPAAARRGASRLPVAADLVDESDHDRELLFGAGIDVTVLELGPLRAHQVIARSGQPGPQLLGDERHERVEQPQQRVEAEVRDVLRRGVAITKAVLHRLEVPVAQLVPREAVGRVDRVLEHEPLDAGGHVARGRAEPGENPAILEVVAGIDRARRVERRRAGGGQDQPRGVPQLVAEAPVALDPALVEANVLARHRDRGRPGPQRVGAVLGDERPRVDAGAQ